MTTAAVKNVIAPRQPSLLASWPGVLATTLLLGRAQPVLGNLDVLSHLEPAAEWLISIQSPSGGWYRHQHLDSVKVIDARVAWSLVEVASAANEPAYESAARCNLDWVQSHQLANGWFRHAAFTAGADPFTHT